MPSIKPSVAAILVFLCALACSRRPVSVPSASAEPSSALDSENQAEKRTTFALAVYTFDRDAGNLRGKVEALRRRSFPELRPWYPNADVPLAPAVEFELPPIAEFAPPDAEDLRYFGRALDSRDAERLPNATAAIVVIFHGLPGELASIYPTALRFVHAVAAELDGVIWDEETREAFSTAQWNTRRIDSLAEPVDIRDHITIHSYRDGDLIRLVTLGMAKLDLADLSIEAVAPHAAGGIANVVNLAAQTLLEHRTEQLPSKLMLDVDALKNAAARIYFKEGWLEGATGRAEIALQQVPPDEGDPDNFQLAITFPGPVESAGILQDELLKKLWGSHDEIVQTDHTAELLAESARARATALLLKPRFQDGLEPNERLMVKAPFPTPDGGNEWMWVDVIRWEGATISGVLQNDPFQIPGLSAGAKVKVREREIFDYIHHLPDGTQVGNTTAKYLQ